MIAVARDRHATLAREVDRREARRQALEETRARLAGEVEEAESVLASLDEGEGVGSIETLRAELSVSRETAAAARAAASDARRERDAEAGAKAERGRRRDALIGGRQGWVGRAGASTTRIKALESEAEKAARLLTAAEAQPAALAEKRSGLLDALTAAEDRRVASQDALSQAEDAAQAADRAARAAEAEAGQAREARAGLVAQAEAARERLADAERRVRETAQMSPEELGERLNSDAIARPPDTAGAEALLFGLEREREALGAVNLRAEEEAGEQSERLDTMREERSDLTGAIARLRDGIDELNAEGRERLVAAFDVINGNFRTLFEALFGGGQAELKLVESDDPLEAGLEIYACPPGKRLSVMSLMSGGEQALTATALIFAVFLANPAPVCVLDEVDAPLDDANVDRFCRMLDEMRGRTDTRFIVITHNPVTMSRMDRLYGVTMPERGVSQLVSVDLTQAETLVA